jgi:phosphate transport system protein
MTKHLDREVDRLKKQLFLLSATVEESVYKATKAVAERDGALAELVIEGDTVTDQLEVDVEEECLKILALHQPVAFDLRFIVAILKMNSDLERIGDLAVNIASRARSLATLPPVKDAFDFTDMSSKVKAMLRMSIESLINLDVKLAWDVCRADYEVDEINRDRHVELIASMKQHPEDIEALVMLISVSRNLERIGDHTTNIAEDVIYLSSGEIVRHQPRL